MNNAKPKLTIAMAQLEFALGACEVNAEALLATAREASGQGSRQGREQGADVVVFPELFISGYHARDLWLRSGFIDRCQRAYQSIVSASVTIDAVLVFGLPLRAADGALMNAAVAVERGQVLCQYHKYALPNDGVFDERRYFQAPDNPELKVFTCKGWRLALLLCEDIWHERAYQHLHSGVCDCLLAPQASPFARGKSRQRAEVARALCATTKLPLIYVNGHGAQDELLFDGDSQAYASAGELVYRAPHFQRDLALLELSAVGLRALSTDAAIPSEGELTDELAVLYAALVVGIRSYFSACGAQQALLGLSGGIDSALCAALLVDALGSANVRAYALPYKFSSQESLDLATEQARLLGIDLQVLPINAVVDSVLASLPAAVAEPSIVVQNAQARARAMLLMACSNASGALLVACSNKSESAMGYCTLYGDMAGALAPLQDVYKTEVWQLARQRNARGLAVVEAIIGRQPTAELLPGQKDSDNLPEYEVLDAILRMYLDAKLAPDAIAARGYDPELVRRTCRQVEASEYKRRQASLGFRVSASAANLERRYPINKLLDYSD